MDMVVVYKTTHESVSRVIRALRKEGFNPVSLGAPDYTNMYASGGTYRVEIAVPADEVRGAESFLRRWDQSRSPEVAKLGGRLQAQFIKSVLFFLPVVALFWLFTDIARHAALLAVIWLVIFALLANVDRIRERFVRRGQEQDGGGR